MEWRIGCSGFSYKEWKNVFYPPRLAQRKWFSHYAEHFPTIELNVSFYKFPTVPLLQNWYEKSPDGFLFAVKAPKAITHFRQLIDCEKWLEDFYTTCREGLKEKLGPLLFQFPPRYAYSEERLQRVLANLDNSLVNVVEFREAGWWNKAVYAALKKKKIIFCSMSHPGLPATIVDTGTIAYFRFHGVPKLYYSEYSTDELKQVADHYLAMKKLKTVYGYFNNTAAVGAIDNARWLEGYVKGFL